MADSRVSSQVAQGQKTVVAVGGVSQFEAESGVHIKRDAPLILTSQDGTTWTEVNLVASAAAHAPIKSVTYGNGRFVAVGGQIVTEEPHWYRTHTVWNSKNGSDWTHHQIEGLQESLGDTVYFKGQFLTIDSTGCLWLSETGAQWQKGPQVDIGYNPRFTVGGDTLLLTGEGDAILASTDGKVWMTHLLGETRNPGLRVTTLLAKGAEVVGLAMYDCCFGEIPGGISYYSFRFDPKNISSFPLIEIENGSFFSSSLSFFNGKYVSAGDKVGTSDNLIHWQVQTVDPSIDFLTLLPFNESLFALAFDRILRTEDATAWSEVYRQQQR